MISATALASLHPFQPHSITDRAFWDSIKADPRFASVLADIAEADKTAPAKPPVMYATDYLAATRFNDRGRTDRHSWADRRTLTLLILNRCLKGLDPADPDDRLVDWIWSFVNESTWAVANHLPKHFPKLDAPSFDLCATEFAGMMAETVEVLRPWMDSLTPNLGDSILYEIDRRVLVPFVTQKYRPWDNIDEPHPNNWSGVCAGSILAACRSLAAQGQPRPEAEAKAIQILNKFWQRSFTPDGECDEGIAYWRYGVSYACFGMSRLSGAELAAKFDLERVAVIADYPRRAHLNSSMFYSGNDAPMRVPDGITLAPWLADATGVDWLRTWPRDPHVTSQESTRHFGQAIRLLSMPPAPADAASDPDSLPVFMPDQQVAILHAATAAGPMIVTLGGGNNAENHNHNDIGHFLVILNGELVVIDLGNQNYTNDYFSAKRYQYMAARSLGHNVPVINGVEQQDGHAAEGKVLSWNPSQANASLSLDLTAAYPAEAKLKSWTRTLRRRPNDKNIPFAIDDAFVTAEPGVAIAHAFWTRVRPEFVAGDRIKLGPVVMHLTRPLATRSEEFDAKSLLLREYVGETLYRVEVAYETDGHGKLNLQTLIAVE